MAIRTMGNFMAPYRKPKKPKTCKGCGKPVRDTVGNSGYCKACIKLAKDEQEVENHVNPSERR